MKSEKYSKAFSDQILKTAQGEGSDQDKHNKFYDKYLAVIDMTAEF
jgi:poly(3-hydroxybutyrate) depolymerase